MPVASRNSTNLLLLCNLLFYEPFFQNKKGNLTLANFTPSECAIWPNMKANQKTLIHFGNMRKVCPTN